VGRLQTIPGAELQAVNVGACVLLAVALLLWELPQTLLDDETPSHLRQQKAPRPKDFLLCWLPLQWLDALLH